ncbi:6,7-dimethyl-8-ribityllumazine synthase [Bradymonas sediminis]|uniref:6,7-dimethyl-8-ribityllumazine synthase n=1 Tax=Bradymonas sediminis TaxID=1548548 RepID=A0A2Z4FJJ2_9DELT|nr:6,7-dimethyl-8-ribityllumazine synthase [Bradymonas sediminis]AWV89099.1 6,7-dimethyl-8-ribityllumazine synthase [Bradymonas sediminis]TDP64436.1 6,7-dimethyl-8-ribityllumazine synthase [Bradymonas sediminis]
MPNIVEGNLVAVGKRFAIVAARWNDIFSDKLVSGACDALVRHGVDDDDITIFRCPGCFELPQVAARAAESGKYDAIICLGVLIRGGTPHFDYIASQATRGIGTVAQDYPIPVSYGVLTCDNLEQAIERSGSKAGNKGVEAALAALEMANLFEQMETSE